MILNRDEFVQQIILNRAKCENFSFSEDVYSAYCAWANYQEKKPEAIKDDIERINKYPILGEK